MAKKVTIETLAIMVQGGFQDVQNKLDTLATKEELYETREILARAIKELDARFSAYMSFNREEIDRLKSWMENVEARISALETKQLKKK